MSAAACSKGATSANQIAFSADVDWQRLAGVTGFSTHLILVNRSGANTSHLFGDNVTPVQEIFGAGGNVAVHLVSAYAEQRLLDGQAGHCCRLDECRERLRQFTALL